jgi:S1-C subfamily serine protease
MAGQTALIDRTLARKLDRVAEMAVRVVGIEASGPAAEAGLTPGDLLRLDSMELTSVGHLHRLLAAERIGQRIELAVLAAGWLRTAGIRPAARPKHV